jgi:hypothetical protein
MTLGFSSGVPMRIIVRANDPVLISFVEALFREAGIALHIADTHISITEGSIGVFPRRVLVPDDDWPRAAQILEEAGLGKWIVRDGLERRPAPPDGEP